MEELEYHQAVRLETQVIARNGFATAYEEEAERMNTKFNDLGNQLAEERSGRQAVEQRLAAIAEENEPLKKELLDTKTRYARATLESAERHCVSASLRAIKRKRK